MSIPIQCGRSICTFSLLLGGLFATMAATARVEFVGAYAFANNRLQIEELRNASRTEGTGPLFMALRHIRCGKTTSYGAGPVQPNLARTGEKQGLLPLDPLVPGGDSRLAAGRSWRNLRFEEKSLSRPTEAHRSYLVVYELDDSKSPSGLLEPIGAASLPPLPSGVNELATCVFAKPLEVNGRHRDYLSLGDGGDYYRLKSYSRGTLLVEYEGNVKAVGELLDIAGRPLANNAGAEETESFLIERHIDDGIYYLRIAKSWGGSGYYNLRTRLVPGTEGGATDRDDNTAQLASPLALGAAVGDAIDMPGDVDWWRFSTASGGRLFIESAGDTDVRGSLFNASVAELAMDEDGGDDRNFLINNPTIFPAGTYYVRVTGRLRSATGPYTLRVLPIPEDASGQPDLVVDFPYDPANPQLKPGEPMLLSAQVRNLGTAASAQTVVRLFQSANSLVSTADARAGSETVDPIEPAASSINFVRFNGFAQSGTHYMGGCVRPVAGETNTDNNCSRALVVTVSDTAGEDAPQPVARRYSVPFLLSASDGRRQGLVRIVNRSNLAGRIELLAVDDAGLRHGPYALALGAQEAVHLDANALESGNPDLGIMTGTGIGQGDWRLELTTSLDIAALAYVRTADNFLTGVHQTAAILDDGRYHVPFFNPASNRRQRSLLRLVNPGAADAEITIAGIDDRGKPPPGTEVRLTLPAGEARVIRARDLESGGAALRGSFGSGSGKWRLFLTSTAPVAVLSLLDSPTGKLSNLSAPGHKQSLPLVLPGDDSGRESFVRIINRSPTSGMLSIQGVDDAGRQSETITLPLAASSTMHLNSGDLEAGNPNKGLSGGLGRGEGGWRLALHSGLDLEALAYIRTADGFVTDAHGLAAVVQGAVEVPFFKPGSSTNPESRLRLSNPGTTDVSVTLTAWDDIGRNPPYGVARVTVPTGRSQTMTARQLEVGGPGLNGRFGDGIGNWRLVIAAEQPIQVMGLLAGQTGHLANLSAAGVQPLPQVVLPTARHSP